MNDLSLTESQKQNVASVLRRMQEILGSIATPRARAIARFIFSKLDNSRDKCQRLAAKGGKYPDAEMSFEDETNRKNQFQGSLRFAPLDSRSLRERCKRDAGGNPFKLVLTHCDQKEPECEADLYFDGPTRESASDKCRMLVTA